VDVVVPAESGLGIVQKGADGGFAAVFPEKFQHVIADAGDRGAHIPGGDEELELPFGVVKGQGSALRSCMG
jgi:hypothetical protein